MSAGGAYGRRRSHGNVLAELRALRDAGPLNYVIFLDDTFTIHHPWVREFCRVYRAEIGVPFSLHARVETVDARLLEELAAAGCRQITYGVESGSERVRREIMKRSASDQRFVDVFRWTREAGIVVTANYILGTPGETVAEMEQTIDLHQRLQPDDFAYFVFYPYPGTALFQLCRERGYLPDDYLERPALHRRSILNLPDVTAEQIEAVYARWTTLRAQAHGRAPARRCAGRIGRRGAAHRQRACGCGVTSRQFWLPRERRSSASLRASAPPRERSHRNPCAVSSSARSARAAAACEWVASRQAAPLARTCSARTVSTRSAVDGSRLPVGSSARIRRGRCTSARAIATRCN